MDNKKLHSLEFRLKVIGRNMRCKLLKNRSTGKTTECSKHLQHTAIEKDIFSELNRCIFQISPKSFQKYSLYWHYAILIFTSKLCQFWYWCAEKCFLLFIQFYMKLSPIAVVSFLCKNLIFFSPHLVLNYRKYFCSILAGTI